MVTVIFIIAFVLLILGLLGSMIPGLPGPPLSFIGILLIHFFTGTQFSTSFLLTWAVIVVLVFLLDYFMQVWGVKKFGGGRKAILGTFLGLFMGLLFPPVGLLIGPFIGAFIGALIEVQGDNTRALNVAIGSFIGFVTGTILKLVVSSVLLYYAIHNIYF
ncbi:MAG: hypothetical protein CND86_01210 [Bacteroidetes bacterium MED-G21]|nr:MAG: hypothetical protein CND86_01210 [Bacteroidetes bacterium MED-G21]